MSDSNKLRRAAAEHLGCDPAGLALLEVTPSREFNYDGGTITWVLTEDAAGNVHELTMEQVLDLPTTYPLGQSAKQKEFIVTEIHKGHGSPSADGRGGQKP